MNKIENWTTQEEERTLEKLVRQMRLDGRSDEEVKSFLEHRGTYYLRLCGYKPNGSEIVGDYTGEFVKI